MEIARAPSKEGKRLSITLFLFVLFNVDVASHFSDNSRGFEHGTPKVTQPPRTVEIQEKRGRAPIIMTRFLKPPTPQFAYVMLPSGPNLHVCLA